MKHFKRLKKALGTDEYGMIEFPKKVSNVKISRIHNTDKMGGCSYCFPHGIECTNSKESKRTRNWKTYRRFQYKILNNLESKEFILTHNNFNGSIEYSKYDKVFFGKIQNISDLVSYEAKNKEELKLAFTEAVNDYCLFHKMLEADRNKTATSAEVLSTLAKIK